MKIVKNGSLMHGWWVGAWQVGWCMVGGFQSTTLIRLLASNSSPRRCILAWMSSSKLQPVVSLKISNLNHVIWTFRTPEMPKTLHLPQVRLEERVSKFRPTCSFRSMPKTTSIDKMVFIEVGDMGLIFQVTKFQPKRRPITHYIVQYVHTAQMVP